MGRMDGKVVIITGAARGQGRSHALVLAREGAQIVATDICDQIPEVAYPMASESDLNETARLVEELDQRCVPVKGDARSSADMRAVAERAISEFGRIDVAVINHGIAVAGLWDETTDEMWASNIETNLTGAWNAARSVIPQMVEQGEGSIIITSSVSGLRPFFGLTSYVASKHGVIGLVKGLAAELGPLSIRVNAICPTNVATPMLHSQVIIDMFAGRPGGTKADMEFPASAGNLLPIPWVEPEAISNGVLFLASDESKFVTGISLPVDAGMSQLPPGVPLIATRRIAELEAQLAAKS
jgi:SDR family mycofactocin-dependent oxidoreductase